MQYSSISRRIGAVCLDALIMLLPAIFFNHLIPVAGGFIAAILYAPVFESSRIQATLGKQLMGIQVADLSGNRISFKTALIRFFMKFVSSAILFIGHLFAFFTERKQALHDLVADTVVIYGRSERSIFDAWVDQVKSIFGSHSVSDSSQADEIERLQDLKDKGVLTEEEFRKAKSRVLERN